MSEYSFNKGWNQVPQGKLKEAREKLMKIMLIKTRASFANRRNGKAIPSYPEHEKIEEIFHEMGITDIWGE
jgi:hypothetical protein